MQHQALTTATSHPHLFADADDLVVEVLIPGQEAHVSGGGLSWTVGYCGDEDGELDVLYGVNWLLGREQLSHSLVPDVVLEALREELGA